MVAPPQKIEPNKVRFNGAGGGYTWANLTLNQSDIADGMTSYLVP